MCCPRMSVAQHQLRERPPGPSHHRARVPRAHTRSRSASSIVGTRPPAAASIINRRSVRAHALCRPRAISGVCLQDRGEAELTSLKTPLEWAPGWLSAHNTSCITR